MSRTTRIMIVVQATLDGELLIEYSSDHEDGSSRHSSDVFAAPYEHLRGPYINHLGNQIMAHARDVVEVFEQGHQRVAEEEDPVLMWPKTQWGEPCEHAVDEKAETQGRDDDTEASCGGCLGESTLEPSRGGLQIVELPGGWWFPWSFGEYTARTQRARNALAALRERVLSQKEGASSVQPGELHHVIGTVMEERPDTCESTALSLLKGSYKELCDIRGEDNTSGRNKRLSVLMGRLGGELLAVDRLL